MPTLTETSTKFDRYMDTSFQHLVAFVPENDGAQARGEFIRIQNDIQALARKRYAILSSTELTEAGKITQLQTLKTETADVVKGWTPIRDRLTDINAAIKAHEDAGNGGMIPNGSYGFVEAPKQEPTPETIALDREIRDRLYTLGTAEVTTRYLAAVETGNDPDLVRAIERAPKAFPLVRSEILEQARETRIGRSPFAARREELRQLQNLYQVMLEAARLSIADLESTVWP